MKMVSFTRPVYSRGERPFTTRLMVRIHCLDVSEERRISCPRSESVSESPTRNAVTTSLRLVFFFNSGKRPSLNTFQFKPHSTQHTVLALSGFEMLIEVCFQLHVQRYLILSYIRDGVCLLRGTERVFNLLKPTGHVIHQQFNIQQLYVLPTLCLCVLYLCENKQRLVPLTA